MHTGGATAAAGMAATLRRGGGSVKSEARRAARRAARRGMAEQTRDLEEECSDSKPGVCPAAIQPTGRDSVSHVGFPIRRVQKHGRR